MATHEEQDMIEFKELIQNRANNLLFCFDGALTTLSEKASKDFFFKQTFSEIYTVKYFMKLMESKACTNNEHHNKYSNKKSKSDADYAYEDRLN